MMNKKRCCCGSRFHHGPLGFTLSFTRFLPSDCKRTPPKIVEEYRSGDLVCEDCGLVLEERIVDMRSEWRTFADDNGHDPSRVGAAANPLLDGPQLDTVISYTGASTKTTKELSKVHGVVTSNKNTFKLLSAYKDISVMCDAIGLSKLIGKELFVLGPSHVKDKGQRSEWKALEME